MNKKMKKSWRLLLYLAIAIVVFLSLVVLPFADTDNPDPSVGNTQYEEDESMTLGTTVTGSAISVGTVTGGAISGEVGGDTEDPEDDPEDVGDSEDVEDPENDDNSEETGDVEEHEPPDKTEETDDSKEVGDKEGKKPGKKPIEEKKPKRTVYGYQDDNIIVKAVFSDAAAVPDNAKLFAMPITEQTDSAQYSDIEAHINDSVEVENQNVTSFLAYDIYFMADGVEYEPELGSVNVTIQYKTELFEKSIKDISDEVKVLHLKETNDGIQVEDVTQEVSLINYDESLPISNDELMIEDDNDSEGEGIVPGMTEDTEREEVGIEVGDETRTGDDKVEQEETTDTGAKEERPEENGIENSHADSVTFVTDSFSTFVVIGLSSTKPVIDVTMKFVNGSGDIDGSVSGTYYLNIKGASTTNPNYNYGYRYNLTLSVINGKAEAKISGLYDQNGDATNTGSLYPLADGSYTAVLFGYPERCADNFEWLDTLPSNVNYCIKYGLNTAEFNTEIYENYIITELPNYVKVQSGIGSLSITATVKQGTKFSSSQILTALSPVRPFSVFAKELNLRSHMDGCIAAQKATLGHDFGNTKNEKYYTYSSISLITVNKIYNGIAQKTFRFGLFKDINLCETIPITLPTSDGKNTASATFTNVDTRRDTVHELDDNSNKLDVGKSYDGYTLMNVVREDKETRSKMNYTSYVENISPGSKSEPLQGSDYGQNILVVGSRYTVKKGMDNIIRVYEGDRNIILTPDSKGTIYAAEKGAFPIDFDKTLHDIAELSTSLATAISTDTVMVKNMTIKELNSKQKKELTFNTNGRILLLNIDATGSETISLETKVLLEVNGKTCNVDWNQEVKNIVVNIFTRRNGEYCAYTGSITNAKSVMGTLLAPYAKVNDLNGSFNGNIVAQYVFVQHEIHGNTMGTITKEAVYTFVNSAEDAIVLPETGGIGTQLFYTLGAGIMFLGIVLKVIYRMQKKHCNLSG